MGIDRAGAAIALFFVLYSVGCSDAVDQSRRDLDVARANYSALATMTAAATPTRIATPIAIAPELLMDVKNLTDWNLEIQMVGDARVHRIAGGDRFMLRSPMHHHRVARVFESGRRAPDGELYALSLRLIGVEPGGSGQPKGLMLKRYCTMARDGRQIVTSWLIQGQNFTFAVPHDEPPCEWVY